MKIKINIMSFLVFGMLVLTLRPAQATHPLATDDTGTQGGGGVEVELSHQAARPAGADSDYRFDSGVSVHVGVAEKIDLGLTVFLESFLSDAGEWRFGVVPPVVDLKWRFWEGVGSRSSLALRLDYSPKALGSLSSGGHDVGALLVHCREFGNSSLHLNLGGYARNLETEGGAGTLYAGGALTIPLTKKLLAAMEAVYETAPFDHGHNIGGMGGIVWEIQPGKVVSVGAGPAWETGGRVGWMATLGFTVALPKVRNGEERYAFNAE